MSGWIDFASCGFRRYNGGEMRAKFMRVDEGVIYRLEDEVEIASGRGGTLSVVRVSYVFATIPPKEEM